MKGLYLLLAGFFAMSFVSCSSTPFSGGEHVDITDPTVEQMENFDREHGIDSHARPRGTTYESSTTTTNTPATAPATTPAPAPTPPPQPAPLPGDGVSPSTIQQLKN